jgi:RNA-directed DNA polymerase
MGVERQQGGGYQLDLFDEALRKALRHEATGDGGTGAGADEEPQALTALERQRALTQGLMERVVSSANLNQAYKRVKANKGAPGADGMTVQDLRPWLADHKDGLVARLVRGDYRPQPVRGVTIPKPGGGVRQLGIPSVVDRLVQQAILQVLQPILEPSFSASSFGFRPGRSAHDALAQAGKYVAEGYGIVVDLDLEKFLDASSYCPLGFFGCLEQVGRGRRDLYSHAFSASAADMDGFEFAALYTVQDGLARHAEKVHGFEHCDISFWRFFNKARAQLVGETNAPRRAGGDLLAGDKTVIKPTMQGGRCEAEFARGLVDGQAWTVYGLFGRLEARDFPVSAQAGDPVGGERQAGGGLAPLAVEDAGDDGVGIMGRQTAQ